VVLSYGHSMGAGTLKEKFFCSVGIDVQGGGRQ
jgi:hypothetical protein